MRKNRIKNLIPKLILFVFLISGACKSQNNEIVIGNTGTRLDSLLSEAEKKGFHGVVLFEQNGKIVLNKGYGYSNDLTNQRFESSTLVQIGSNVKDFTKTAIYQLVEKGKLKLSDPLSKFIPGLTGSKQNITVQHLLDHTAGFPLGIKMDNEPFSTSEMLASIQLLDLKAEPGTKEIYSNLGYSCLAYIVEKISGLTFDNYIYQNILKPLGLSETGTYLPNFNRARIAHGYGQNGDIGIILDMPHDADGHLWSLRGNGGYLSTTLDMNKFYNSFLNNSLIKDESHRKSVYNPAQSNFLAGSDMISFFLFNNIPELNAQIVIATNHSSYKGNHIIEDVVSLFQTTSPDKNRSADNIERQIDTANVDKENNTNILKPLLKKLPGTGAGLTINKYIDAFNTGDVEKMKVFFLEYGKTGTGTVPLEKRIQNYKNFYAELGKITFIECDASQGDSWEVNMSTDRGVKAKFIFHIEAAEPWRFEGLQISIGD